MTPGSWRERAACRGLDPGLFVYSWGAHGGGRGLNDEQRQVVDEALLVCAMCTVRTPCLEDAIEHRETCAVWGGEYLSEVRMRQLRRRREGLSPPQRRTA